MTAATVQPGATVTLEYTLQLPDGSSAQLPEAPSPMTFVVGEGKVLKAIEDAIIGLSEGDQRPLTVTSLDAFGKVHPRQRLTFARDRFAPTRVFALGQRLRLRRKEGDVRHGQVVSITNDDVEIDFNHPLAGKKLKFTLHVLKITPA
jgi:FKBP-type peptidyl-prolyl cis-trans isomerase SlpA